MKRKIFSMLLVLTMVLSLLPGTAWAETQSGSVPFNINYSYNTDTKVLTLSGSGPLNDNSSGSYFQSMARIKVGEVKKVVINSGMTEIGDFGFKDFHDMTSISIPSTVTRIGNMAFNYCYSLSSIKLPKNLKTIEEHAFYECYGLSSITIPAKVTTVGRYAFQSCDALQSVTFQGSIKKIEEHAFAGLDSLSSVKFPAKVASGATIGPWAFSQCPSLRSVTIPEGVTVINEEAFSRCSALHTVELPSTLQYLHSDAFYGCSLQSITFTGDAPSIDDRAFWQATATAYYPASNPTWTEEVLQQYGGTITWVPQCMGSHSYGSWTGVDDSTHKKTCTVCGKEKTADHSWDEGTVTTAPTCQATGEALFTCTDCGATKTEVLPIADHSYSPWAEVDDATHTHACTVCGVEETVNHTWDEGKTVKAANCIAEGEMKYTCTGCGITRNEIVPVTGIHTYDHGCDKDCNICSATRTTSHKYSSDWSSNKSGHWHTCVNCGAKQTAVAHVPGPEPTEKKPQLCTVCDYVLQPSRKHEHVFAEALTCDETGHWYACESCNEQKDLAQHDFDNDCDTKCDTCGFERITQHVWSEAWSHDEAGHFHVCSVCAVRQEGSESEHDWRRGVCKICEAVDPNYEPAPVGLIALIGAAVCAGVATPVVVLRRKKKNTHA